MKIVNIIGGLGNQMFQMALAISLKKSYSHEEIKINTKAFNGYSLHNGFELEKIFNISIEKATTLDLIKVAYPYVNHTLWRFGRRFLPTRKTICAEIDNEGFKPEVLENQNFKFFDGYWQNEEYFIKAEKEVRKAFTFKQEQDLKNRRLIDLIKRNKCASIHIRRGDYVTNSLYNNICNIEYYKKAIDYLIQNTDTSIFLLFSNDIEWCKRNISPLLKGKNIIFVNWNQGNKSYMDMHLMSLCNFNIIANSSFSWWAAWLNNNTDKIVVCPKMWNARTKATSIVPEKWTKI